MTSTPSAQHRTARWPASSGDAPEMLGQDVTPTRLCRGRVNGSKVTILVILLYLLKNNTTFMCGMEQEIIGGGPTSSHLYHTQRTSATDWRIVR